MKSMASNMESWSKCKNEEKKICEEKKDVFCYYLFI